MGDRAVDCARLESVCAARHQGFEYPPIRASYSFKLLRVSVCKFCRTFTILALGITPRKFAPGYTIQSLPNTDPGLITASHAITPRTPITAPNCVNRVA